MSRDELVSVLTQMFLPETTEEELSAFEESIERDFGANALEFIYWKATTLDPNVVADGILALPKQRVLITPPPDKEP